MFMFSSILKNEVHDHKNGEAILGSKLRWPLMVARTETICNDTWAQGLQK